MKQSIILVIIALILTSCGITSEQTNLFEGIDLSEDAAWLLAHRNMDTDSTRVIADRDLLRKYSSDLKIKVSEDCMYTTPDNCVTLIKNGAWLESVCYCSWELLSSADFGRLDKHFVPAKQKKVVGYSIWQHDMLLDSLKKLSNVYLLYPKDTIIRYPDQLKFDILTDDNGQDIFEQEKPIEEVFKQTFQGTDYSVKADFYMSSSNPPQLGYHVTVDCDSSFLKQFDPKFLSKNDLFCKMSEFVYVNKTFDILYFQWK